MKAHTLATLVLGAALGAAGTLFALRDRGAPDRAPQDPAAASAMQRSAGHHHHDAATPSPDTPPFVRDMERDMARMMGDMHAPGYTGNRDVDFLAMMIPHHQGAIDMAKLVLVHGSDPLTRSLAEEIIASQQVEIDAMRARLVVLQGAPGPDSPDAFPALEGTRGSAR